MRSATEERNREIFLKRDVYPLGKMIRESYNKKIRSKKRPLDLITRHSVHCTGTVHRSQTTSGPQVRTVSLASSALPGV